MAKKKKGTPEGIDKLFDRREVIGEEAYTRYWRRLNRARRKGRNEFESEAERIRTELVAQESARKAVFRSSDYDSPAKAKRAAEIYRADFGGRIVRRDSKGRFSKRGTNFQVIRRNNG